LNAWISSCPNDPPSLENKSDHLLLIIDRPPRIDFSNSAAASLVGANFLIPSRTLCLAAASISPKVATPSSASLASPDNNASFTSPKNFVLSFADCLLNTVRIGGNILSISTSRSLDKFLATFASAACAPIVPLSMSKNS